MALYNILYLGIFCLGLPANEGLYFSQRKYDVHMIHEMSALYDSIQLYVRGQGTAPILCNIQNINYTTDSGNVYELEPGEAPFTIHNATLQHKPQVDTDAALYNMEVMCRQEYMTTRASVMVHVEEASDSSEAQCFPGAPTHLRAEENMAKVILGRVHNAQPAATPCTYSIHAAVSNSSRSYGSYFSISELSGEIRVDKALDYESDREINITLECFTPRSTTKQWTIVVEVIDMDDHGPWIHESSTTHIHKLVKHHSMKRLLHGKEHLGLVASLRICDADVKVDNQYEITVHGNQSHLLQVGNTSRRVIFLKDKPHLQYETAIHFVGDNIPKSILNFSVIFNDTSMKRSLKQSPTAEYDLQLIPVPDLQQTIIPTVRQVTHASAINVNLPSQAARFARVVRVSAEENTNNKTYTFRGNNHNAFGITHTEGIIYVTNTTVLREHVDSVITLRVNQCGKATKRGCTIMVIISITPTTAPYQLSCDRGCSGHAWQQTCESSCGLGTTLGLCHWRTSEKAETRQKHHFLYETCRADVNTCPDGRCDELEALVPQLCPQDCTSNVSGSFVLNSGVDPPHGITEARSPCVCNDSGMCRCEEVGPPPQIPVTLAPSSDVIVFPQRGLLNKSEDGICHKECKTVIIIISSLICGATFIGTIMWKIRKKKISSRPLRHVGSGVSLNAIPSDYVSQQQGAVRSASALNWSYWSPVNIRSQLPMDNKWEFPRGNVILEKTLGEGEFGQVVQAQALNINGNLGYSTVAIKMLKSCASGAEFRDLWSEFNLLKDVNHPNVIKLLGACTHNGPFYMIVEHCEHGSLRQYLHTFRDQKDTSYMEDASTPHHQHSPYVLLSFAWQVAKGMQYLSHMKVVHRDLAARNVLVAAGNTIKISDFGLSRDIYEEDTYLKRSKGRIPVKWMAPESLYDHIYTTKSDVWSYGVLLWEIVTFGSTPYPGIHAGTLFHLLKTGYRMQAPSNCSQTLCEIMDNCWEINPNDRPTFHQLADKFELMLLESSEYLDLSSTEGSVLDVNDEAEHKPTGNTPHVGSIDEEEDSYGSISRLSMDQNAYLSPMLHPCSSACTEHAMERAKLLPQTADSDRILKPCFLTVGLNSPCETSISENT